MRKIISKKTEEKKNRRTQFIVGGLLILIMALSTIGYSINNNQENSSEKIIYKGIELIRENNLWNAEIGNYKFGFLYNPSEVEEINSSLNYLINYNDKPLYIYSENSDAMMEIYRNLFYYNNIVERVQEACPEGEICNAEVPIKDCTNNFIIIKKYENSEVKQENNCVFISGSEEEIVKIADGFLFKITGIQ